MNQDQHEKMSEFSTAMSRIVWESGMDPHEAYVLMVYYGIQRTAEERGIRCVYNFGIDQSKMS